MKKKLLGLFTASLLMFGLAACGGDEPADPSDPSGEVETYYTIAFNVDGTRHATARVKEGEHITQTIADPVPAEGYRFVGWYSGDTLIDLATYVVTGNATFEAHFEEIVDPGDNLKVDDVKEAGVTYYLAFGWWETTDVNEDGSAKHTSYLTPTDVKLIYRNIRNYLTITGTTEAELGQIQFRDYSSTTVAIMGEHINADDDVDILFGVGNNINSTAGVALYESSNDYKFQAPMGSTKTARYVAATSKATAKGIQIYNWLKNTDAGKKALTDELTEAEIRESLDVTIDLTVTIHGETDAVTHVEAVDTTITLPTINVPSGYHFVGYALTENGEVVLTKAIGAAISYNDVKDLATGATLDLYPIFEQDVIAQEDLVVYVQLNSGLKLAEGKLLEARFNETLTDGQNVKFNFIEADATGFTEAIGADADVVIGGNNPVNNFAKHADGPTANAGAKHFANTSRKIIIKDTVNAEHLTLAKALYNFVIADAVNFEVHVAYWTKDYAWITEAEETALKAGVVANLNTYLGVGESENLLDKYNVTVTQVDVPGSAVADLGADTKALREGKGTDLIIGCGGNVDSATGANVTIVAKQDIPTTMVAAGRKVALVRDNALTRNIYEVLFATPTQA